MHGINQIADNSAVTMSMFPRYGELLWGTVECICRTYYGLDWGSLVSLYWVCYSVYGVVTFHFLLSNPSNSNPCRNLVRRQLTWFRNNSENDVQLFTWIDVTQPLVSAWSYALARMLFFHLISWMRTFQCLFSPCGPFLGAVLSMGPLWV
jgi:hypothetical protein